jgi:hypothetical protein
MDYSDPAVATHADLLYGTVVRHRATLSSRGGSVERRGVISQISMWFGNGACRERKKKKKKKMGCPAHKAGS